MLFCEGGFRSALFIAKTPSFPLDLIFYLCPHLSVVYSLPVQKLTAIGSSNESRLEAAAKQAARELNFRLVANLWWQKAPTVSTSLVFTRLPQPMHYGTLGDSSTSNEAMRSWISGRQGMLTSCQGPDFALTSLRPCPLQQIAFFTYDAETSFLNGLDESQRLLDSCRFVSTVVVYHPLPTYRLLSTLPASCKHGADFFRAVVDALSSPQSLLVRQQDVSVLSRGEVSITSAHPAATVPNDNEICRHRSWSSSSPSVVVVSSATQHSHDRQATRCSSSSGFAVLPTMKSDMLEYSKEAETSLSAPEICCSSKNDSSRDAERVTRDRRKWSSNGDVSARGTGTPTPTTASATNTAKNNASSARLSPAQFFHSRRLRNIELTAKLGLAMNDASPSAASSSSSGKPKSTTETALWKATARDEAHRSTTKTPAEAFDELAKSFVERMSLKDSSETSEAPGTETEHKHEDEPKILERGPVSVRTGRNYYSVSYQLPESVTPPSWQRRRHMVTYPPTTASNLPYSYYKEFPFPHFYGHRCNFYQRPAGHQADDKSPRIPQLVSVAPMATVQRSPVPSADTRLYAQGVMENNAQAGYVHNYQPCSREKVGFGPQPTVNAADNSGHVEKKPPATTNTDSELAFKEELPEILSDFILKYSRRYAAESDRFKSGSDDLPENLIYGDV
ncbi:unnamed protein product, partial [Soboliphyme baturini]|uniref:Mediator of RNA polymerase II transcription subunit 13 n=1 Tax=Soboliphyme baturini TaxID=241478 RepID=A0A183IYX9_9BILA